SPKVDGLTYLDEATKNQPLELFITFSSVAGAIGNTGQADYATANAFMDQFAILRNQRVSTDERSGHTLSVNWPLWKDGGMHVGKEVEKHLFKSLGMVPLPTEAAIQSLYHALQAKLGQVMIVQGDRAAVMEKMVTSQKETSQQESETTIVSDRQIDIEQAAIGYFKELLSSVIKLPTARIKTDRSMEEYGIDSVMIMQMTEELEKVFGTLSKTLFFEYQNVRDLTNYFINEHYTVLSELLGESQKTEVSTVPQVEEVAEQVSFSDLIKRNVKRQLHPTDTSAKKQPQQYQSDDIAIIGLSGRYPQADDLEQFWSNLCEGKDSVTEIPVDRWDHSRYFDEDRTKTDKAYSKWGGFINGFDEFDPRFFNISPREAEFMDPQERLFLQCAHQTIEDAGYSRKSLAASGEEQMAGNVGVFAGVMYEEYQLYGAQASVKGKNMALYGNSSSVANRVSYFYNFNGPSVALNTMCSASLTAIHLACQSIQNGDCKAAIAGGVNLSIHPNKYLLLSKGKFVSGKGRCESFGLGGEGYVPAEGVGAVMLKPLSQAIADGDHVYGVIKGTSVNHGGKTNGYTVPNPNAQAEVIKRAFERSGIDPRTVSYMEAHGTGTSLGDPIEIAGLKKAFGHFTKDTGFCSIGSVKSNIGHGESAAGMAGLTKILLQLKHQKLVPSLHSASLNPNIDFASTPFTVQQSLENWQRPTIGQNGQAKAFLRRAGLSSFGAGGSNAHLVIEEFEQQRPNRQQPNKKVVFVLSARNEKRLRVYAERMLNALETGNYSDDDLVDIAYTLQEGRDALESRLAIVASAVAEVAAQLKTYLEGATHSNLFVGKVAKENEAIDALVDDQEFQAQLVQWMTDRRYNE
ncbi:MAG: beta-ketoacyl synthase N-terminal-like domain-containing protein, partial [Bacteroidota bacterium]